jgi:hypothetical protein
MRKRRLLVLAAALAALVSTVVVANVARAGTNAPAAAKTINTFVTLYGFVDNSPPGTGISGGRIHSHASGTGTFADPVTYATAVAEQPYGTRIYIPYMKKYFIHEDECVECDNDWKHGKKFRTDLWAGGDRNSLKNPEKRALLACEDSLTRHASIIVNPASNLPVDKTPIFNAKTLKCFKP